MSAHPIIPGFLYAVISRGRRLILVAENAAHAIAIALTLMEARA